MLGTNEFTGDSTNAQPCSWQDIDGFIHQTFHQGILLEVFYNNKGQFIEYDTRQLSPEEIQSLEKETGKRINYDTQH